MYIFCLIVDERPLSHGATVVRSFVPISGPHADQDTDHVEIAGPLPVIDTGADMETDWTLAARLARTLARTHDTAAGEG